MINSGNSASSSNSTRRSISGRRIFQVTVSLCIVSGRYTTHPGWVERQCAGIRKRRTSSSWLRQRHSKRVIITTKSPFTAHSRRPRVVPIRRCPPSFARTRPGRPSRCSMSCISGRGVLGMEIWQVLRTTYCQWGCIKGADLESTVTRGYSSHLGPS